MLLFCFNVDRWKLFFVVSFFIVCLMSVVIVFSVALPVDIYRSLWNSKNGYFEGFFSNCTILQVHIPKPSRKRFTRFMGSNSNFILFCLILCAKIDPNICVHFVF